MANYEYDMPNDDVRVFDGGDEDDVEGSRLPLLIVIALLVLAAFGGVVWLAYQRGVAQGHAEVPRTIAAEQGPVKVAPANPGGTPTPYTGLKIYQQPAPDDASGDPAAPASAAGPAPKPAPVAAVPATTVPTEPVSSPPTPTPVIAPAPVATPPAQQMAATAPPKPVVKAVAPPPAPKPSIAEAPPAPAPAPVAASSGGAMIQIGSYKSEADANAAWTAYKAKHGSIIGSGSLDVAKADLGAKGTWYRARIAGFASKAEAAATCTKLKADGADCIVAH
jgi:hypothetical protein